MMARGFRRVMELKRSMLKKPRRVENYKRNRGAVGGWRKPGGGAAVTEAEDAAVVRDGE